MTNFKKTTDKVKEIEKLGHIPSNIGFDPFLGYEFLCHDCGLHRYLLGMEAKRYKEGDKVRCKSSWCGRQIRFKRKMDKARAFHLNDIKFRGTTVNES